MNTKPTQPISWKEYNGKKVLMLDILLKLVNDETDSWYPPPKPWVPMKVEKVVIKKSVGLWNLLRKIAP